LVTGASQGIGKAIALAFASEKCRVGVVARREDQLQDTVKEMGGESLGHSHCAADLQVGGEPEKIVEQMAAMGGDFEIVVHNVGGTLNIRDPIGASEEWFKVWHFNVGIAIEINRIVVPPMRAKKWGRVIHVSSISAESVRGATPYAAAKAYLNAYVKGVGRSLAPEGIVFSALMPGSIYSPGGDWDEESEKNRHDREFFRKKRADFLRHHQAIGRLGVADEVASFAVFMASQLVTLATGAVIPVDGGTM
jgi:3-oxoacyl-[acyl-carrier protein] reductase